MNIEEFREYCLSFAGTHDDFPFRKASSASDRDILVFYVADKWFAFVNAVAFDFCNLKLRPERICELRERYADIGPGWHMNKRYWVSVRFDGDVPDAVIRSLVRESYELVAASLPRAKREASSEPNCKL
ncbi:MmcQ/YjbR family DNA-binding protein [Alistipes sp.]|uniref:MmcQ/YjbR family DNA-binding protein n=1 Tax=Alistipes sp. TaxID=1872444 RepID=UPI003AF0355B